MSASDGYVVGVTKVVDHGPESSRWDLVIVGDGYRASELTNYHTHVQSFIDELPRMGSTIVCWWLRMAWNLAVALAAMQPDSMYLQQRQANPAEIRDCGDGTGAVGLLLGQKEVLKGRSG